MAKAAYDFVVYHDLSNRPLEVREGDELEIVNREDVLSQIRFIGGEAKGNRIHTVDNFCINFEDEDN